METAANLQSIITPKTTEVAVLTEQNKALTAQLKNLQYQLDWLKRQIFGRKSEKRYIEDDSAFKHPDLFEGLEEPQLPLPPAEKETITYQRRKKTSASDVNDSGLRFDDSVPQKIIELSAPELNGADADRYEIIDYKETYRLAQQVSSYMILVYRRPVLRLKPSSSKTGSDVADAKKPLSNSDANSAKPALITTTAPGNVLEGCYADVSVLAGLLTDKAVYHLPLYRQHQRIADAGITLSRTTLTNWTGQAIDLIRPIHDAQLQNILRSQVLAMDETPMKAGIKTRGKMQQTYYWPIYGDQQEVAFTWSKSRGIEHAKKTLAGFSGTLISDGYHVYERLVTELNKNDTEGSIIQANCWAHARRYFEKAKDIEPVASAQALTIIGKLYQCERRCQQQCTTAEAIAAYRQKHAEPIVKTFFDWLYEQTNRLDLMSGNPIVKALNYAKHRHQSLKVFLSNPHVPLDTNHLERALRVIPMGRKNYLFCWTEIGAERMGVLQSLMVTCRLHGINPYEYLVDVLQRISLHPAKRVIELTPRVWKARFKGNLLTSDVSE